MHTPLFALAVVLVVGIALRRVCERLRVPTLLGLLLTGFLIGPHGAHALPVHSAVIDFFSDLGKLMILFFAGLEIDLERFHEMKKRSIFFGAMTFSLPFLAGLAVARVAGYGWNNSVLVGSLMASHTLLALPIVQSLGLMKRDTVTVTVGATMFTDIASLLTLAMCLSVHEQGFSVLAFGKDLLELAIYIPVVLFAVRSLGRKLLDSTGDTPAHRSYVLLLSLTIAAIGAEAIELEGIVGAFLGGLAINAATGGERVSGHLESVAHFLFIPAFFVTTGLLIDPAAVTSAFRHPGLVLGIVLGLVAAKLGAAAIVSKRFGWSRNAGGLMWSLSLPQVAATLSAALVAYDAINARGERLLDQAMLNAVLVLMVVTSTLGPLLTERFGARFAEARASGPTPALDA